MNNLMMEIRNKSNVLHKAAESSGFTYRLLNKNATVESYSEYIYNLAYVYESIEYNLDKFKDLEDIKPFVTPEIYRSSSIRKDVKVLSNNKDIDILPSTLAYVNRINSIVEINPKFIIAHAYTRFLADLFGGRIFYSLLKEHYKISDDALNYYVYENLDDMREYVMKYHNMLNSLNLNENEKEEFILEICNSYIYNLAISSELDAKLF
ncbi:biliverdin-producing heme oxygenase [Clostridium nigeriense]|uniref:biliverdin-producing heme oxygenase n=1 Tax=Clostridium nigeriense TaxID=1805470 RepID=UPI00083470F0|nr:biliverdin-producing heme oxygenase [Clostridium nigeriense]